MAERLLGGRYQVVRHLARGGMAEVYLAHDQLLDRRVAVKLLFPELAQDGSFVERFRREARAAAGLNHHNIVSVYDFGEDEGSYFIVMEYVDGPTLRDIIRGEGPLEPAWVAEVGADVAAALAVAHQHGIIHRDVKPGNVLIAGWAPERGLGAGPDGDAGAGPEGNGTVVKVADFGIARAVDARESLTMTGAVMGTATYLSPEQAQGHTIDRRSDLYSLGIVLYEMLAGRPPFSGDTPVAIAYKHLSETPVPPSTHNPAIPPALDATVLRAMEKDPDARYGSAERLRADLLAAARGPAEAEATEVAATVAAPAAAGSTQVLPPLTEAATAAPPPPYAGPTDDADRRRRRAAIGLGALVLLAIVAVLALLADDGDDGRVTVPSVVGLDVEQAREALERVDLRSVVEEADRAGEEDRVLEQRPGGQTETERTTTVTLVVPAPTTTVPTTAPRTTPTTRRAPTTTAAEEPATTAPPPATAPPATAPPRPNPTRILPTNPGTSPTAIG